MMIRFDPNIYHLQRAIYIAEILNKHFVCSPSILKNFPFDFLRKLYYSDSVMILDFIDASNNFSKS